MSYCSQILTEAGIEFDRPSFICLSEANQIKVTDEALTGMMKFITDKYNSLDFGEIERSAGDIARFKYYEMIMSNTKTLSAIYSSSKDPGAAKYLEVTTSISTVMGYLLDHRKMMSDLYKSGNGMIQLLYTSLVAACIYATGTLVSNTIRFVTTEKDTDCEVLYDEIPGSIRNVHIKNILAAGKNINDIDAFVQSAYRDRNANINESIALGAILGMGMKIAAGAGLAYFGITFIINFIRETIYSVYYTRVKLSEMIAVQQDLVRTNIEHLEVTHGDKKVIARQRKIADKLEVWKNRVAIKIDTAEALKKTQMKKENAALRIDRDNPLAGYEETTSGILL